MEKRSDNVDKSKRVKVLDKKVESRKSETTTIVLLRDLNLNYIGPVTGKRYVFTGAGSTRDDVDVKDAEIMLRKLSGDCCPGGSGPQPYFEEG